MHPADRGLTEAVKLKHDFFEIGRRYTYSFSSW